MIPAPAERRPITIGESAVIDRLRDEAARITRLRNELAHARRCRNLLVAKLATAGYSYRQIAAVAGMTNVRISQVMK